MLDERLHIGKWISDNRQWVFSGIGVFVLGLLLQYIRSVKNYWHKRETYPALREHVIDTTTRSTFHIKWTEMCQQIIKTAIYPMKEDHWVPDAIVAVGRGGAIVGSIIASTMRVHDQRLPIMVLDVEYADQGSKQRINSLSLHSNLLTGKSKVLIVDSNWQTGGTARSLKSLLLRINSDVDARFFALVWAPTSDELRKESPDYYSYYSDSLMPTRLTFPWYLQP